MTANCTDFPFVLCSFSSAVFSRNILLSHHISNPSAGWVITLLCLGLFPSDCATIYSVLFFFQLFTAYLVTESHCFTGMFTTLLAPVLCVTFSGFLICIVISYCLPNIVQVTLLVLDVAVFLWRCFCCFFICILLLHGGIGNHQKRLEQKICGFKSFLSRCLEWAASSRRASRKV